MAALVTVDTETTIDWQVEHQLEDHALAELADSDELRGVIAEAIGRANAIVSRAESIREFRILPHDLSEDRNEITPTLKVKRTVVERNWSQVIDTICTSD